jgi:hypothetical protein
LRKYQFYTTGYWAGGLYASPSMTGSRAGGSIAGAWATMVFLGDEGYMAATKLMYGTMQELATGISAIPGLKLVVQPDGCCISFIGEGFNALQVADLMEKRGWKNCNRMQKPAWYALSSRHLLISLCESDVLFGFLILACNSRSLTEASLTSRNFWLILPRRQRSLELIPRYEIIVHEYFATRFLTGCISGVCAGCWRRYGRHLRHGREDSSLVRYNRSYSQGIS